MSQMSQMSHTTDSNGYAPIVGLVGCVAFRCAIFAKVHSWHDAMCDATSEYRPGQYTRVFITAKVALSPWRPRWSTREY
jgi:hypothetical protein